MRLGNLACQGEAESAATALGRIKRQHRIGQHGLAHARTAIANVDAHVVTVQGDGKLDVLHRATRFDRVLQQIDEQLLDLAAIEPAGGSRWRSGKPKRRVLAERGEERQPLHRRSLWHRQLGEMRIALHEAAKMPRALLDRVEDPLQAIEITAPRQFPPGMGKRADRCQ